jgi:hypothetical protein
MELYKVSILASRLIFLCQPNPHRHHLSEDSGEIRTISLLKYAETKRCYCHGDGFREKLH